MERGGIIEDLVECNHIRYWSSDPWWHYPSVLLFPDPATLLCCHTKLSLTVWAPRHLIWVHWSASFPPSSHPKLSLETTQFAFLLFSSFTAITEITLETIHFHFCFRDDANRKEGRCPHHTHSTLSTRGKRFGGRDCSGCRLLGEHLCLLWTSQ